MIGDHLDRTELATVFGFVTSDRLAMIRGATESR